MRPMYHKGMGKFTQFYNIKLCMICLYLHSSYQLQEVEEDRNTL